MAWEVWWALVFGFAISAVVQAWVPRERIERALGRVGCAAGRGCDGPGRRIVLVLLRGDRDRQEPLPEGRLGEHRACLPVRLHEPRVGARPRAVGADRLAVHARRVRRRTRDDRADGAAAASVRLAAPGGAGARARPAGRHRPPTSRGRRADDLARAADLSVGLVGCRAQLPRRLADALQGDHRRVPARRVHRAARQRLLQRPVPQAHRRRARRARERDRRPDHRHAELRLLGRQRAARGGAVVGRDQLRRGDSRSSSPT